MYGNTICQKQKWQFRIRKEMKLTALKCGESGEIIKLEGPHKLRLSELGFNPGTPVKMICCGCLGGPVKVNCRQCDYAIRIEEASCIIINKIDEKLKSISSNDFWWYKDL
jgi:Fe2+ transport system protein FeoA